MDMIGATAISIYYSDGQFVDTIRYTDIGYSSMMAHNTVSYSTTIDYPLREGESFYAIITLYAYDGSDSDSVVYTTNTIELK